MIAGIVAAESIDTSSSGGGTAELDFVSDTYVVNGDSLTLADVIDTPGARTTDGLEIFSTPEIFLIGDIVPAILTGRWTIVIEFNATAAFFDAYYLSVFDDSETNEITLYGTDFGSYFQMKFFESGGTGPTRFFAADPHGSGIVKMAWTRTDLRSAGTMSGEAVNANSKDETSISIGSWTDPPTKVRIASANGTGGISRGFIRKLTLLSPQSDSELATLTS